MNRDKMSVSAIVHTYMYMTFLIIHEVLRRKDKATQHNSPKAVFFKEKAASGGTRTHDRPLARRRSYQLSYRGNSPGWARITYTIHVHVL